MKVIKISMFIILGGFMLLSSSCKKSFYTSANQNPNAPLSVTPAVLLSTVEGSLAYSQGGDISRFASMFTQQTAGISRQCGAYYQYIFTGQDVDNTWGNLYTSVMENDLQLIQLSDSKGYNVYSGVSRVLMAYTLQITVDCWGSIPYSKALEGKLNMQPSYDVDKGLYGTILSLCDSAITFLSNSTPGYSVPGSEDVIYAGNAGAWINFAHAIKARIYMHQSKANPTMASNALNEIAQSFASNSDNAQYVFGTTANSSGPWYQFNNQRDDISFASSTLATAMLTNNDPRFSILIDTTTADGGDWLGAYYGNPNAPVEFITYEELQFMTAEATITKGGTVASAQTAWKNGIKASMTKLGLDSATTAGYITSVGSLTSANALSKICYEEWVALYLNPEAWTMWRRTGYPTLTPAKAGANIPRRLLYPQTEYSYNKNNTPASTLYTPQIFWDN